MKFLKEIFFVSFTLIFLFPTCKKEKWEGQIYTEEGVTVVENTGEGLWRKEDNKKVTLKEEISLGVEEGKDHLMFFGLRDVAVDEKSNIYIVDGRNHRLLKFDKEGNFLWQSGRKGQGPGEFQYPGKAAITLEGEIAVEDQNSIQVFNSQGNFQRFIKVKKSIRDFQFLPDGRLFVNIYVKGQPGVAAEYYSSKGKFLNKFPVEYRYGPKLSPRLGASIGGGYLKLKGQKVYFSLPDQYEIREYDLKGNVLRKIKRDIKLKPANIQTRLGGRGVTVHSSDSSGPCFVYKDKMLINCLQLVEKIGKDKYRSERFLDFFNEKGQFLISYKLPENYTLSSIDSENKCYFIQWRPFPKVIRATLNINN